MPPLMMVGYVFGLLSLFLLFQEITTRIKRVRMQGTAEKRLIAEVSAGEHDQGSRIASPGPLNAFLESERVPSMVKAPIVRAELDPTRQKLVFASLIAAAILAVLLSILLGSVLVLPICLLLVIVGLNAWLSRQTERHLHALRSQIPAALDGLAGAIGSGLSLLQAFSYVASQTKEPLQSKLQTVPMNVGAGMSLDRALGLLQREFPPGELDTLFVTLELHHRTGGNLGDLLTRTAKAQREAHDLREQLRVKTAQAKLSARIVGILPLALLGVLTLFSGEYIDAFFASPVGLVIFFVALAMEGAGYFLVKKMAQVD